MSGHRIVRLVAIVSLAAIASGCGDDAVTTTTTAAATPTTLDGQGPDTASSGLSEAIAATGDTYAFTSVVTTGDVEITTVEGVQFQGTGSYIVTTGGATIEYIVATEGRWFRQPLGEWIPLQEPAPVRAPLAVFSAPASVERTSDDAGVTVYEATFDGASIGFTAGDVTVTFRVRDGVLAQIEYTVALGDAQGQATVVTSIDTETELQPITLPEA